MRLAATFLTLLALCGCATARLDRAPEGPVAIRIIGINDFHGALDFPKLSVDAIGKDGTPLRLPAGGAAYLASAVDSLKAGHPNNVVVSAGDLIGASPLSSSLFLDEPSIMAMNMIGLEFNAVGNHEFDRGLDELRRMQSGGCAKFTVAEPCRIDRPFPGAKFRELAANTMLATGGTLFPSYGVKSFGTGKRRVKVGFIGLTLKGTSALVSVDRIRGASFADEAETANALVPKLKAEGVDVIVLLIHQGVKTQANYNDSKCGGIAGDLLPIVERLDPAIEVIVSGHTHWAYVCDYAQIDPKRPVLFTSAGYKGQFVTAIDLAVDPASGRIVSKSAQNVVVQSQAYESPRGPIGLSEQFPIFAPRADVAALAKRYSDAARRDEARVVGRLAGPASRERTPTGEIVLGNIIADAQLAANRQSGAQIAFMNPDGIRADLVPAPDGTVSFGSVFLAQPFANPTVTITLTGRQIKDALEQQFTVSNWVRVLSPSRGFAFAYDNSRPAGQRILSAKLDGADLVDTQTYRVAMSEFLANGGDMFEAFTRGTNRTVGPLDIDALIAWLGRDGVTALPPLDRVTRFGN